MPTGIEIARITPYPGHRWNVSYKDWAACGCYYRRNSVLIVSEQEPDEKTILEAIKNNEDTD